MRTCVRFVAHWTVAFTVLSLGALGCSPSSLVDVQTPGNTIDPSQVKTATAAAQMRMGALLRITEAMGGSDASNVLVLSGMLTDELSETPTVAGTLGDTRQIAVANSTNLGFSATAYDRLQAARVYAAQAQQALQLYASGVASVPRAWQGEMYAMQAYAVLWLGELYCSGIPLSSAPLVGAQLPSGGLTTDELFMAAVALFDSALVAGVDSARFVNLARIGKGRALLDLGDFTTADSVVASVPTDFVYDATVSATSQDSRGYFLLPYQMAYGYYRTQDHEGGTGLVWSTDPRTAVTTIDSVAGPMLWPAKYAVNAGTGTPDPTFSLGYPDSIPLRIADGLEARLIQAEAALANENASWLTTLNTLRATCVGTAPCAPIAGLTSSQLPPLADPGSVATRLDLVMKERAMWLYLTGHREGDLRRLAHVYHRSVSTLWPTGLISSPAYPPLWLTPGKTNGLPYGSDTVYQPDPDEARKNPLYSGCYDTNP